MPHSSSARRPQRSCTHDGTTIPRGGNLLDPTINKHLEQEKSADRQREREAHARRIEAGEKPWETQAGVMSVVEAARDMEFPKKIDDLTSEVGDRDVRATEDVRLPMARVLGKLGEKVDPAKDVLLDDGAFPSLKDFQSSVQRHWDGIRFMAVPEEERPEGGGFQPQQRDTGESGRPR